MFENLTNSDVIILGSLIGIIIVIGIICIILTVKGGNKKSVIKENDVDNDDKLEPDIHIALATDNIPQIEEKDVPVKEEIKKDQLENIEKIVPIEIPIKEDLPVKQQDEIQNEEPIKIDDDTLDNLNNNSYAFPSIDKVSFMEDSLNNDSAVEEDQDMKNKTSIEEVLKAMQVDLEKEKYDKIDRYEEDQEENAVISYKELLERKMALNEEEPEEEDLESTYPKTSYLDELPDFSSIKLEPIADRDESKPFINSEFVSPIFGRLSNNVEYPTVKKTTETEEFNIEKISLPDEESDETDEFLNTLKEFRKNL